MEENRNLFTIYKVSNPEMIRQLHIQEADPQDYDSFMQIQHQFLQVEGEEISAITFNNMSEYMRNFDLRNRIEKLEKKEKERDALFKLIKNHYQDTTKFIERKYNSGAGDPD